VILKETKLVVSDNSGAKKVKCIKIFGGSVKKYATLGDLILVSIRKKKKLKKLKKVNQKKVLKKKIYFAFIITTKKKKKRKTGHSINFQQNKVILANNDDKLIGTRIIGPICLELRKKNKFKIVAMAKASI